MANPQKDIYIELRKNRITTLSCVIIAGIVSIVSVIGAITANYNTSKLTVNKLLTIDKNGEVLPLTLVDRKDNIKIEIKDHLEKWFERYYSFDYNNVRTKPKRGQWLISSEDYKKLNEKYESWFKEIEMKKLTQKSEMEIDSIVVNGNKEPFSFRTSTILTVSDGETVNKFRLKTSGTIVLVSADYPKNPHGFMILDYKEEELEKLLNVY